MYFIRQAAQSRFMVFSALGVDLFDKILFESDLKIDFHVWW